VQITARMTHPNTVSVFDYGRTPDGIFYYAMEYLDGVTLQDLVDELGPLPPPRAVHVLLQICGALAEAHENGLVHRDIKPANVMLAERGGLVDFVKVLDFGLVKEAHAEGSKASAANVLVGTPHYLAPEAVLDPRHVDARTDLYALGASAFFLLTGSPVFRGRSVVELCGHHLHTAPEFPAADRERVPEALQALVLACLAKEPAARPESAAAVAARLRNCGVDDWTQEEATAWWATSAAQALQLRIRARATSVDGSQQSNVTIELAGRDAAA
jgi:serine/threonine protein kinase